MYKVDFLDSAKSDFNKIVKYYDDNGDFDVSDKVGGEILDCIERLNSMPFKFPKHRQRPQYRWCGVYDYMIFYKVTENPNTVEIHRILHGAQNIENIL
jgi:plasmid stabilization system protein ParE